MFSRTAFLNILEKATSHLQLEPDWNSIIAVSDCIRQGDVEPKFALNSIKKKLTGPNLHVNMFALLVLESCVKNCGPSFHAELATKSFMEELYEIVKGNTNEKIKEKILELIQTWTYAFRNQPSYRPVQDMCNLLKLEGFKFPQLKESDAMFSASVAPEWVDGDCCNRCRVNFSLLERRHHCRACGNVFCNKCSSKQSIIPKFGIEKEVRVCEDCYEKLNSTTVLKTSKKSDSSKNKSNGTGSSSTTNQTTTTPSGKTKEELLEEEELQMAIALSKSEAEIKEKQKRQYSTSYQSFNSSFENELNHNKSNDKKDEEQLDPNLNLYMNRAYWEQKSKENNKRLNNDSAKPSAPQQTLVKNQVINKQNETEQQFNQTSNNTTTTSLKGETDEENNIEQFQNNLRSTIEIFVNRMNSNKHRGRPISNDSAVQSMFLNVTNMHSQLLKHIQQQDELRSKFELLQDKLSQAKDARAALDSLRDEYNEKLRREAEEAEMLRQQQMAFKLDIMRKKKQEYLHYQRQIALQRVQEGEMKMRLEQQKYGVWPNTSIPNNHQQITAQQPTSQPMQYPVYPPQQQIQNYNQQPINYADPQIYNQQHQIVTPNPQQFSQQNGIHPSNILPQNPHISTVQQVITPNQLPNQLPNQQLTMPIHQQVPSSDPNQVNYQSYNQGLYNMQALNNSLPVAQSTNQQTYVTQTVETTNGSTANDLPVNKQTEEAPLISFD